MKRIAIPASEWVGALDLVAEVLVELGDCKPHRRVQVAVVIEAGRVETIFVNASHHEGQIHLLVDVESAQQKDVIEAELDVEQSTKAQHHHARCGKKDV